MSKGNIKLKDNLINKAKDDWKKSDKHHASKKTVKWHKPATGLKLYNFLENRGKFVFKIIYINIDLYQKR